MYILGRGYPTRDRRTDVITYPIGHASARPGAPFTSARRSRLDHPRSLSIPSVWLLITLFGGLVAVMAPGCLTLCLYSVSALNYCQLAPYARPSAIVLQFSEVQITGIEPAPVLGWNTVSRSGSYWASWWLCSCIMWQEIAASVA